MGVAASRTDEYAANDFPNNNIDTHDPHTLDQRPESPPPLANNDRNASSLNNITATEFVWSLGGHSVYVTGAWDDWRVKAALSRTSPTDFTAVLALPVGTFQFKFIVDGNWKHSPALPTERDQHGNLNNIVVVKPQVPEYDSNVQAYPDNLPDSPIESYDYSIIPQEDQNTEPPALPRLLSSAPVDRFNICTRTGTDFVRFNHVFGTSADAAYGGNEIRTMATESRYKTKIITTILITARSKVGSVPLGMSIPPRPNRTHPQPMGDHQDTGSIQPMGESQSLILDALNNV